MLDLILCVDDDPITLMLQFPTTFSNEIVTAQMEGSTSVPNSIKPKDNDNSTRQPHLIFF
jgi:hypothetical protein